MRVYVSSLTLFGSDNALSSGRRQAIIWTNAGVLLIGPLGFGLNMLTDCHNHTDVNSIAPNEHFVNLPVCMSINPPEIKHCLFAPLLS